MIKLLLSIIFVVSSALIGNTFSMKLINRKQSLSAIHTALGRAKTMICFGGADVYRVLEDCFYTLDFPLLDISNFSLSGDFTKNFEQSVSKISRDFSLSKSDKDLLIKFGVGLGTSDVTGQVAHIELYENLFAERLNSAKEQEASKAKLYRVLGVSFGLVISLLLV